MKTKALNKIEDGITVFKDVELLELNNNKISLYDKNEEISEIFLQTINAELHNYHYQLIRVNPKMLSLRKVDDKL